MTTTVFTLTQAYASEQNGNIPHIPPVRVFSTESGAYDYLVVFAKNRILDAFQDCLLETLESEGYHFDDMDSDEGLIEQFDHFIDHKSNVDIVNLLVEYEGGDFNFDISEHPTQSLVEMLENADLVEVNGIKFSLFTIDLNDEECAFSCEAIMPNHTVKECAISYTALTDAVWNSSTKYWFVTDGHESYHVRTFNLVQQ